MPKFVSKLFIQICPELEMLYPYFIFNMNWIITISYRRLCFWTQPNYPYMDHWHFHLVTLAWLIRGETRWLDWFFISFIRQPLLLSISLAPQEAGLASKGLSPAQNFTAWLSETSMKSPSCRERYLQGSVCGVQGRGLMSRSLILFKGVLGQGNSNKQLKRSTDIWVCAWRSKWYFMKKPMTHTRWVSSGH